MEKITSKEIIDAVNKAYETHIVKMPYIFDDTLQTFKESKTEKSINWPVMFAAMMTTTQKMSAVILNATLKELFSETECNDNE